ncbi:MAG: hypothetical protein CME06_12660, partial [Gemmatimonadetes bacterium]|nr:hypothetical protein [Gemmatimonadota bacterium]
MSRIRGHHRVARELRIWLGKVVLGSPPQGAREGIRVMSRPQSDRTPIYARSSIRYIPSLTQWLIATCGSCPLPMFRFPDLALGELERDVLDALWSAGPLNP